MSWVAVDRFKTERMFNDKPLRLGCGWARTCEGSYCSDYNVIDSVCIEVEGDGYEYVRVDEIGIA